MGETNVERLVNRWETDGIGRGEWNTQAICRALRAAIEADRDQPPEGAVRVRIWSVQEWSADPRRATLEVKIRDGGEIPHGEYDMIRATDRGENDG